MPRRNKKSQVASKRWQNRRVSLGICPKPSSGTRDYLDHPECKEEVFTGQQEWSSRPVQEEELEPTQIKEEYLHCFLDFPLCVQEERDPRPVQEELLQRAAGADASTFAVQSGYGAENMIADWSAFPLPVVQSEYDNVENIETESEDGDESRETEPLASTENGKTLAHGLHWEGSALISEAPVISSNRTESNSKDCDKRGETERENAVHIGEKRLDFSEKEDLNTSCVLDCKVCGRIYKHRGHLKKHVATHTLVHSCVICEKVFDKKCELKVHMVTHLEDIPFVCTVCGIGFIASSRQFIEAHQDTHRTKTLDCSVSGKSVEGK